MKNGKSVDKMENNSCLENDMDKRIEIRPNN